MILAYCIKVNKTFFSLKVNTDTVANKPVLESAHQKVTTTCAANSTVQTTAAATAAPTANFKPVQTSSMLERPPSVEDIGNVV